MSQTADEEFSTQDLPIAPVPRGVLFDMDGLLIDSERIVRKLFLATLHECYGHELDPEKYAQLLGRNRQDSQGMIREWLGQDFPVDELWSSVGDQFKAMREKEAVNLMPGVEELLDALEARDIPKAVATSSSYASAEHCLEGCGVLHRFSALVGGDMISNGKPHPEIYQLTAKKLGVAPQDCWALEDSENGTRSAKNAQTYTIMVPDLREPTEEMRAIADAVVPSLHHVRHMLEDALKG